MAPPSFLRAAARCWESAGHFDRAAERFARADAWADAGRCWALAGRPVESANAYARAGEPIDEARQWLASPWPERALRPYRQALEKRLPTSTEVEALLGLGEIGLASSRAFDVASESGQSSEALRALARLASARGRPDLAARAWDQAIGSNPAVAGEVFGVWERAARWNRSLVWKRPPTGAAGWPSREFRDVRLELVWEEGFGRQMGYGNRALSWSEDGRRFAAFRYEDTLIQCDLTGREVRRYLVQINARSVAFIPRSDSVLVGCSDGRLVRVDPSGENYEVCELRTPRAVWSVEFSPTGDRLSISGVTRPGAIVQVWSWTPQGPGQLLWEEKTFEGTTNPCCAWSSDGRALAWYPGPWSDDRANNDLWLFHEEHARCLSSGHENGISGTAFSPDGLQLVTASDDRTLSLRDALTGDAITPFWTCAQRLNTVTLHPQVAAIATGGTEEFHEGYERPSKLYLLRLCRNEPVHVEVLQERATATAVNSVAFSPDGQYLLMSTSDRLSLFRVHLL